MFWVSIPLFYLQNLITGGPTADVAQIVSAATFTHWVKPQWNNSAVPGSWSIACEAIFYFIFSICGSARHKCPTRNRTSRGRNRAGTLHVARSHVLCGLDGSRGYHHRHGFTFYSFSTQAPCFAAGILIFRLL
jgi:peptidoglycan/LPS O-acetylase OafA/YrhL